MGIDAEADGVTFSSGRETIVEIAALLNELAATPVDGRVFDEQLLVARKEISAYVVPKPVRWKLGDVFTFNLSDGSYAYGQVVGEIVLSDVSRQATCALFDRRTSAPDANLGDIRKARAIAVLHIQERHLTAGAWQVIGSLKPLADPYRGPCGHPFEVGGRSWDGLENLANAYFGLAPWNAFHKHNYLDDLLLPKVGRPKNAVMLDDAELAARGIKAR